MSDLLIVVDMQNGFVNERSKRVVRPTANFLQSWLERGGSAVVTRFINPPGSKWEDLIHWKRLRESPEIDLVQEIAEVIAPFISLGQVLIVDKSSYTSLTQSVIDHIEAQRAKDIYLCGVDTDACVLKTAVDVFEYNDLRPFVLTDLCASSAGESVHDAGLLLVGRYIGTRQMIESSSKIA
jgi:nicotinamidase-related amidase